MRARTMIAKNNFKLENNEDFVPIDIDEVDYESSLWNESEMSVSEESDLSDDNKG